VSIYIFNFVLLSQTVNPLILAGFVNPGSVIPPLADPSLYFAFENPDPQCQKDQQWLKSKFAGSRIYAECLLHTLKQWRLPRRCISILFATFTTTTYQERLFQAWNEFNFLFQSIKKRRRDISRAEMIKVSFISHSSLRTSFIS